MARPGTFTSGIIPEVEKVVRRFPWAVIAASALALYFLLGLHRTPGWFDPDHPGRVPIALTAAFLLVLATALVAEARGLSGKASLAMPVAGLVLVGITAALHTRIDLSPGLIVSALTLCVGVAAYTQAGASQRAFWQFNHDAWVGWIAAVLGGCLFGGGLSAVIEVMRYLFGFEIPYSAHEKVWAVACGFVAPVYWLSVLPDNLSAEVTEGPATEFVGRMVALLGKFILVPLLLVYAIILHAYALKVGIEWALPKGRLGWLTLSFGTSVALTALLVYPTRASSGPMVAMFWRVWPWLLVLPLVLLGAALATRISQYGLTEARYGAALIWLWLVILAGAHGLGWRDLRLMPAMLAGLLMLAAFGPWGLEAWPARSQANAIASILVNSGQLKSGRVVPQSETSAGLSTSDRARLVAAIDYLNSRRKLHRLRPLFAGDPADPFVTTTGNTSLAEHPAAYRQPAHDWQLAQRIKARLGITPASPDGDAFVNYYSTAPGLLPLGGGRLLIGPLSIVGGANRKPVIETVPALAGPWTIILDRSSLIVEGPGAKRKASFNLAALVTGSGPIVEAHPAGSQKSTSLRPILLGSSEGSVPATLVIQSLAVTRAGSSDLTINGATLWIYLEQSE